MSAEEGPDPREAVAPGRSPANRRLCTVEGCGLHHKARGWCRRHYVTERAKIDPEFREAKRAQWRAKAAATSARRKAQAGVYVELRDRGLLP